MEEEFRFTSPSGRPQKISVQTQAHLDKWRSYGIEPPPVRPNETQQGYMMRIANQLENRKRGYYGGEEQQTYGRIDPRDNAPRSKQAIKNDARGRSVGNNMVQLRGRGSRPASGLLAMMIGSQAISARRAKK